MNRALRRFLYLYGTAAGAVELRSEIGYGSPTALILKRAGDVRVGAEVTEAGTRPEDE